MGADRERLPEDAVADAVRGAVGKVRQSWQEAVETVGARDDCIRALARGWRAHKLGTTWVWLTDGTDEYEDMTDAQKRYLQLEDGDG